jgi:hypothetical protein
MPADKRTARQIRKSEREAIALLKEIRPLFNDDRARIEHHWLGGGIFTWFDRCDDYLRRAKDAR